jgi:hypothetical protein
MSTFIGLTALNALQAILGGASTYPLDVLSFVPCARFSLFWCINYPQFAVDNFTCPQGVDNSYWMFKQGDFDLHTQG